MTPGQRVKLNKKGRKTFCHLARESKIENSFYSKHLATYGNGMIGVVVSGNRRSVFVSWADGNAFYYSPQNLDVIE